MIMFLVLLGFGLLAAGVYKAMDNRRAHTEQLARIRREIEQREAAAARRAANETDTHKDSL